MNRNAFLNSFHSIMPEEYEALQSTVRPLTVRKGEDIIKPGQVQRQLYFVKSGVQMCRYENDGKSHVIAFTYTPNLCALPDSFYQQKPSKYYYTSITESEIDCLDYTDLQVLFDRYPNIDRLFRKINERLLSGILNLHLEFRSMSIEQRFTAFCRRSPHLLQQVPHKYIASYLGIDATNFSKLFNRVKI